MQVQVVILFTANDAGTQRNQKDVNRKLHLVKRGAKQETNENLEAA